MKRNVNALRSHDIITYNCGASHSYHAPLSIAIGALESWECIAKNL